jgi:hypothetical protein
MVDVYRDVLENAEYTFLYKYPHYGVAGHTLHKKVKVKDEGTSHAFPYSCMQPLPFLPPAKVSRKGE